MACLPSEYSIQRDEAVPWSKHIRLLGFAEIHVAVLCLLGAAALLAVVGVAAGGRRFPCIVLWTAFVILVALWLLNQTDVYYV